MIATLAIDPDFFSVFIIHDSTNVAKKGSTYYHKLCQKSEIKIKSNLILICCLSLTKNNVL
jgi:hypothetical protein